MIDAGTHQRIDVLPDRKADTLAAWLRAHPGVEIVVRDGPTTYAEAVRRALPAARQASDRRHLWHGLAQVEEKAVAAHSACWAEAGPDRTRRLPQEQTILERWHAIHSLLKQGVGLLDCSRRLGLSLNTVKRYARVPEPDRLHRPPRYRACLVDAYRDHLRTRRAAEPGVPVLQLFNELKAPRLHRRSQLALQVRQPGLARQRPDHTVTTTGDPRDPDTPTNLPEHRRPHLDELLAACPEMTARGQVVRDFAQLMTERRGTDLDSWIKQVREAGLIELEPFLTGLDQNHDAAVAGLTLPYANGPCEGVNTKTKLLKRQVYGHAGLPLL
ncbi:transposase [Nocardia terpenica]|uniref:HTH IS21-type domain-containing protein n=1 Tax=Nocardia terpenica TaxID=455432 RepID=A0A6G9ZEH7_9NOCA|nr:transposase [Nocardia terpenica]QIS23506.1 hypothetical protein F6W96_39635 [Nocardia terpenica]